MTTSTPEPTARCARHARRAEIARRLRASFTRHDVSYAAAALAAGTGKARVAEWCDPEEAATITLADLEALPVAVLRDLLGPVLEARGLALTELPTAMDATSAKAAAQFVRESGSAAADLMEAHADGVLSPSEAATVIESLDEAIAAGLAVRAFARRALTVPIRRIGRAG